MAKTKHKKRKRDKSRKKDKKAISEENHQPATAVQQEVVVPLGSLAVRPGCSWGSAFAAAAAVQPEALDEDFLRSTESNQVDEGLSKISKLAVAATTQSQSTCDAAEEKEPSPKRQKRDSETHESSSGTEGVALMQQEEPDAPILAGQMVPHPRKKEEQVMVLVDVSRKRVYSAAKRTLSGDLICMGTVDEGDIVWNADAFAEEEPGVSASDAPLKQEESASQPFFPYPTDPDDHCESPLESYRDILPFLDKLCHNKRKDLAIYDPYYCDGAVKRNLAQLGFLRVHNQKEDCYHVWATGGVSYPSFSVLITNPPYSETHIPQLMEHLTCPSFGDRAWFLLMPNWVHKKDYYKKATAQIQPFYLVPKKRYVYLPPKQFRDKKASDVHKKSSPFVSMWYCWAGTKAKTETLIAHYRRTFGNQPPCDLARTKNALRDLRRKATN